MKRVLIVDDSTYMRITLRKKLSALGLEVVGEAGTGEEALDKIDALKPDLITLDNILPDITGIDVLRSIRENGIQSDVLMISAVGQQSAISIAEQFSILGYLIKPFSDDELKESLNL